MAKRTCTLCKCWVSLIDIDAHYDQYHANERTEWPILSRRYHNATISSSDDEDNEIETIIQRPLYVSQQIFLTHKKTAKDTGSYPIAWHGKPFLFNTKLVIKTLWSHHHQISIESVHEMIERYADFKQKILNSEFKYILNTKKSITNWEEKALQIVEYLEKEEISKPFRQRVDEKRDEAPKYYQNIKDPMDLYTLKSLIKNKKMSSAKKFVSNLMLIWENAQLFNQQSHEIYQNALKLRTKSNKLIKKYWPNEYKNLYESRRRSKRLKKNQENKQIAVVKYSNGNYKVRKCLLCGTCGKPLRFMCGFHVNCHSLLRSHNVLNIEDGTNETLQMEATPHCNECEMQINDINIWYYHCIAGCSEKQNVQHSDHDLIKCHSVFLCEICAERHYNSQQVKINNDLAFYGCFLDIAVHGNDLWYEAIRFESDANRIYYQLIFSSETHKRHITEAVIYNNPNKNKKMFHVTQTHSNKTQFTKGILSADGLSLTFIDKDEENNNINQTDSNALRFKKVRIFCKKCGKKTTFMSSHTFPSNDISSPIWCDTHSLYYEKQKLLSPEQRCIAFTLLDEKASEEIYKQDFYFSCIACNDFDQCAICVLIQHEIEFKAKVIANNKYYEPSHKRQRLDNGVYIDMSISTTPPSTEEKDALEYKNCSEYEKLKEMYICEKRKNELLLMKYNNNNQKLNAQIVKITNERNQCIHSFNQLKQNVISVFNSCNINKIK